MFSLRRFEYAGVIQAEAKGIRQTDLEGIEMHELPRGFYVTYPVYEEYLKKGVGE
jgi:hypothetical protein